jgi:pyruvate dehydrogenase E2 component (dihydrolipoamide acetyltransferase)
MAIALKMPALSPTMEEGTLAKWLVKAGDMVKSGDILAEIETDKATMEFEAVDEGTISEILIAEGSDGVKVGTVIATMIGDDEAAPASNSTQQAKTATATPAGSSGSSVILAPVPVQAPVLVSAPPLAGPSAGDRVKISPLARKIANSRGIDPATLAGTGPGGRIVKADVDSAKFGAVSIYAPVAPVPVAASTLAAQSAPAPMPAALSSVTTPRNALVPVGVPHETVKLSNMRKTIARRLTESKQQVPHIYLTVDVRLDALLSLRAELNASLASRNVKLSVNDMLIKALAVALIQVPKCNVSFAGDTMLMYSRADISVAVSVPTGLITPIIVDAGAKSMSAISTEMGGLAAKAKEGKLQPHEYQGGTASISNMGMMGIKQFEAVINPPQGMILAIGAGEKRPYVVDDALAIATVMSATGSFDHRAIDGADGAELMKVFKELVEKPLGLVA